MSIYEAIEWQHSVRLLWGQVEYILTHPEEFL